MGGGSIKNKILETMCAHVFILPADLIDSWAENSHRRKFVSLGSRHCFSSSSLPSLLLGRPPLLWRGPAVLGCLFLTPPDTLLFSEDLVS